VRLLHCEPLLERQRPSLITASVVVEILGPDTVAVVVGVAETAGAGAEAASSSWSSVNSRCNWC